MMLSVIKSIHQLVNIAQVTRGLAVARLHTDSQIELTDKNKFQIPEAQRIKD